MKKLKKVLGAILALGMMTAMSFSTFALEPAAVYTTPAEILAGLTERTVESVIEERAESGKTYGTLANEAGLLTEFKAASLALKTDILTEEVELGTLTQEEADSIIASIQAYQAWCNGTGTGYGYGTGTGYGYGWGMGHGGGHGRGHGGGHGCYR